MSQIDNLFQQVEAVHAAIYLQECQIMDQLKSPKTSYHSVVEPHLRSLEESFNQLLELKCSAERINPEEISESELDEINKDNLIEEEDPFFIVIQKESLIAAIESKRNDILGKIDEALRTKQELMLECEVIKQRPIIAPDEPPIAQISEEFNYKEVGDLGEPFFMALDGTFLPEINPALGIYPFPTVGYYCDTYPSFEIEMLIKKNGKREQLLQHFPRELQLQLAEKNPEEVAFYFIVANTGNMQQTMMQHNVPPVANLLCHAWKYPTVGFGESHSAPVEMGIFTEDCMGINAQGVDSSIASNGLSQQEVCPHPADSGTMCCSPNNARFAFDPNLPINDFWAAAKDGNRWVITYNVLINHPEIAQDIAGQLEGAQDLTSGQKVLSELAWITKRPELEEKWNALLRS